MSLCVALVVAVEGRAHADDIATAEGLFRAGKDMVDRGDFASAYPKFEESLRLSSGIGTMLYLADCYEHTARLARAWAEFREAESVAAREHDPRERVARSRAARLEARLPLLRIDVPAASRAPGLRVDATASRWAKPRGASRCPSTPVRTRSRSPRRARRRGAPPSRVRSRRQRSR